MKFFLSCLLLSAAVSGKDKLEILHKWRSVDFDYPSRAERDASIQRGSFIPGNPIPLDIDIYETAEKKDMFITMPRFKDGVPASLVTISKNQGGESPLLAPYPDWSWHNQGDCSKITSAFRVQVDKCQRLWVIDSGMIDLFKWPRRRLCQPQLLVFNLKNDKLAGKHLYKDIDLTAGSVLATVAVDTQHGCQKAMAYVADVTGFAIIVFDSTTGKSWRVQSNSMFPYPIQGLFKTNGVEFDLMDGTLGLALSPPTNKDRTLYYHAFASFRESWVSTSILKNESLYVTGFNGAPRTFKTSEEARVSQAASEVFDKNGNLYFGLISRNTLACWNMNNPYTSNNIHEVLKDDTNLQFITGIKIHENPKGEEEIYMLSDRFQLAMVGQMDSTELNFRVMKAKVSSLSSGCKGGSGGGSHLGGSFPPPISFPRPNQGYGRG